jgi:hypothetical protein
MKVPPTMIVTGINSKDLLTKSGTPSGRRTVKFFSLQKRYNSTASIPTSMAQNKPFAPKFETLIPPSTVSVATNKNANVDKVIHPGMYNL